MANAKCTMPPELREEALKEFWADGYLTSEEEWAIRDTLPHYLAFETYGSRNFREAICTHKDCGVSEYTKSGRVDVYQDDFFRYHHGDDLDCPCCGNPVKLISLGKIKSGSSLKAEQKLTICRVGKSGALLLISGYAEIAPTWNDIRCAVDFTEKCRTYIAPGMTMQWQREYGYEMGIYYPIGWKECKTVGEPFHPNGYLSDGSAPILFFERIRETGLRYSQAGEFWERVYGTDLYKGNKSVKDVVSYLAWYAAFPQMEYAVKIGLDDAVEDLIHNGKKNAKLLNWNSQKINSFLKMGKADARALIESERASLLMLKLFHDAKDSGTAKSMEELLDALAGIPKSKMGLLQECSERCEVNLIHAGRYIMKQCATNRYTGETIQMWADYLDMGWKLGYDMTQKTVTMPKNLQERHDAAAATVNAEKNAEEQKRYKNRYKVLVKLYEFSMNGYSIVVPKDSGEIIREGKTLNHCVAGYAARHIEGKTDILFLRRDRKPDTPFITIEMAARQGTSSKITMRQIHGYRNEMCGKIKSPRDRFDWLLSAWMIWMQQGSRRDGHGKPIIDRKEASA